MDDLESIDRKKDKKRMKSVEAKISKRTGQSKKKLNGAEQKKN